MEYYVSLDLLFIMTVVPFQQDRIRSGHNISIFISWITVATRLEPPDMDMDIPVPWHQDLVA